MEVMLLYCVWCVVVTVVVSWWCGASDDVMVVVVEMVWRCYGDASVWCMVRAGDSGDGVVVRW